MAKNNGRDFDAAQRDSTFRIIVGECRAFYKQVVTVATLFLGGTLLFIEKITPHPAQCTLVILGLGWLSLVLSILGVTWVRRDNIECGRLVLCDQEGEARAIQRRAQRFTDASGILLAIGVFLVMLFGFVNFWIAGAKESSHDESGHRSVQPGSIDSIPEPAQTDNPGSEASKAGTGSTQGQEVSKP